MTKKHLIDDEFAEMTPNIMPPKVREQMRRGKHMMPMRPKEKMAPLVKKTPMRRFK